MKKLFLLTLLFCVSHKSYCQITFNYTGSVQYFTVPAGITSLSVDMSGAAGGSAMCSGFGGAGGRVQATLPVTPGAVLNIFVGGSGLIYSSACCSGATGGSFAGGAGGYYSGGGGGATDIRIDGTALSNRVIVAGGGGGAGYDCCSENGGAGGGLTGGNGIYCSASSTVYAGQGGTQTAGGAGATTSSGGDGTLGTGGSGIYFYYGGAGGGGYYGGGGGYYGSGGGGSSYTDPSATSVAHTQGYNTGNGYVILSSMTPCSGTITGGATSVFPDSGSSSTYITLSLTGSSLGSGITYQWYSSTTGATGPWSAITGATNCNYNYSGMTTNTYFKCFMTCTASGDTATSSVSGAVYVPLCGGAVVAGTVSASPEVGDSTTSFTLSLSGSTYGMGLTFSWQSSATGLAGSWTTIPGATDSSLSFTGVTSNTFYRSIIHCVLAGASDTSSAYEILAYYPTTHADSFTVMSVQSCTGATFNILTNRFSAGQHVKIYYGDGFVADTSFVNTASHGFTACSKTYATSGNYSVKAVLFDSTTAVDSASFSQNIALCNEIRLGFYYDALGTCVYNPIEDFFITTPVLVRVDSNGATVDTISATSGLYYKANGNPGDVYTFTVVSSIGGMVVSCPLSGVLTDTFIAGATTPIYFGFTCVPSSSFDLYVSTSEHTGRHGQWFTILAGGNYLCSGMPAHVNLIFSPNYIFESSVPAPYSVAGNIVDFRLDSLTTFSSPETISVTLGVPSTWLTPGDTVMTECVITPFAGDTDTLNNVIIKVDTVVSSYDPNHISVSPGGCLPSGTDTTLQYTIEFENTGNDTAHNIYVMDTLPANVIASSMRIVAASNAMFVSNLTDTFGHHICKFAFPGINLLDSAHHNQCTGMLIFNVKTQAGLPDETVIGNHAGVFFDDNPVVLTDTASVVIGCPLSVPAVNKGFTYALYPNPAGQMLTVQVSPAECNGVTITNMMGQQVMSSAIRSQITHLDISRLQAGVYYVTFNGTPGGTVAKFVKM